MSMMVPVRREDTLVSKVGLPDGRDQAGGDDGLVPCENAIHQDDGRDDDADVRIVEDGFGLSTQPRIVIEVPSQGVSIYDVGFHSRSSGILYSAALISS